MSDDVKPALTPEEWAGQLRDPHGLDIDGMRGRPHAVAALCLHGQPFGFTWGDVRELDDAVERLCEVGHVDVAAVMHIRDRIEALLPPEGS